MTSAKPEASANAPCTNTIVGLAASAVPAVSRKAAAMDTGSYDQFAEGYYLTAKAMAWFWDAYAPDVAQRGEPYASPLRATDEQLAGVPPAFVIVDEADVLRDEGEAYAARLRAAGVAVTTVRYDGAIHDFMMLNPLSATHATRAAVAQATAVLRAVLHDGRD